MRWYNDFTSGGVIRQITWGFIGCCVCSICTKLFLLSLNKQNNTIQIYLYEDGGGKKNLELKIIKKRDEE